MSDLAEYSRRFARESIINELHKAEAAALRAALLLLDADSAAREDAFRVRKIAQALLSRREVIVQRWEAEDAASGAPPAA